MPGSPIKIGYSLSLTGPLAANGQTAHLAHQIWQGDVNARGGLLGREIELICIDDRTDAASVPGIYESLLTEHHADLLLAGLAEYTRTATFPTVVGDVSFGPLGEWAEPRVLTVQFRGIHSASIGEFAKPGARVIVSPESYASGDLVYPYLGARKESAR